MLKRKLCELSFTWSLECEGPLLIADGRYDQKELNPDAENSGKYPDKVFISRNSIDDVYRRLRAKSASDLGLDFYIPATSLRGPLRAQAERIIRTLLPDKPAPITACDPFEREPEDLRSCSQRLVDKKSDHPYESVCPACKLFGCTGTASRLRVDEPKGPKPRTNGGIRSVYRDMIGIDRFTGGVYSGANMRFHVLENTRFETTVTVANFEWWQIGLLAYVLRDFQDGLAPIGFGKTKGFGLVKGSVGGIALSYPKGRATAGKLPDLGSLVSAEERKAYGLDDADELACPVTSKPDARDGLSLYDSFEVNEPDRLWQITAPIFNTYLATRGKEDNS